MFGGGGSSGCWRFRDKVMKGAPIHSRHCAATGRPGVGSHAARTDAAHAGVSVAKGGDTGLEIVQRSSVERVRVGEKMLEDQESQSQP